MEAAWNLESDVTDIISQIENPSHVEWVKQANQNLQAITSLIKEKDWVEFYNKDLVKGYKLKSADKINFVKAEGWIYANIEETFKLLQTFDFN